MDPEADVVAVSRPVSHPWLDLKTWGPRDKSGHYSRELNGKRVTLFYTRRDKWLIAIHCKFHSLAYNSLREAIDASYRLLKRQINAAGEEGASAP